MKMYAVVLNDDNDTIDSLYVREAEAWMVCEGWDAGKVWVAVVDVTLGDLVNVTSDEGAKIAYAWEMPKPAAVREP